jgi:hypothetical protein
MRVRKGIFVSREWSIFVRVKCEMLDFSVVKCDLFYSREAWLLIKTLREMRLKDVCFVNCDFALFISIYFIIVIINMIRDNQFIWSHSIAQEYKNFGGRRTCSSLKLVSYDVVFNWQVEKWENLKRRRYCTMH